MDTLHPIPFDNVTPEQCSSKDFPWNIPVYGKLYKPEYMYSWLELQIFSDISVRVVECPELQHVPTGYWFAILSGLFNGTQSEYWIGMNETAQIKAMMLRGITPYNPFLPEPSRSIFWDTYENSTHAPNGSIVDPYYSCYLGLLTWDETGNIYDSAPLGITNRTHFYTDPDFGDKFCQNSVSAKQYNPDPNSLESREKAFTYEMNIGFEEDPKTLEYNIPHSVRYGEIAKYYPYFPHGVKPTNLNLAYGLLTGSMLVVIGLRLYGRKALQSRMMSYDILPGGLKSFDLAIFIGALTTATWGALVIAQSKIIGRYVWDVRLDELFDHQELYLAISVLYPIALLSIKVSLLLFYASLTDWKPYRIAVIMASVLVTLSAILSMYTSIKTYTPIVVWGVTPIGFQWDDHSFMLRMRNRKAAVAGSAVNIATDVIIWALPMPLVAKLKMQLSIKDWLLAVVTFGAGGLAIIGGAFRYHSQYNFLFKIIQADYHTIVTMNIWTMLELNLAIICACVPTLRALVIKAWPKFMVIPAIKQLKQRYFPAKHELSEKKDSKWNRKPAAEVKVADLNTLEFLGSPEDSEMGEKLSAQNSLQLSQVGSPRSEDYKKEIVENGESNKSAKDA